MGFFKNLFNRLFKSGSPVLASPAIPSYGSALPTSLETPWMDWLKKYDGTKELLPDGSVNPFITDCFLHTDYHTKKNEAWCAAGGCRALEESGYLSPHNAAAESFINYGSKCELKRGCVVVIQHLVGPLKGHYHITFCENPGNVLYFTGRGCNQNNQICVETFSLTLNKIVWTSWPIKRGA